MIAAGLHGIDHELALEPAFEGNAYAGRRPRVPPPCATRWTCGSRASWPARRSARRGGALRQHGAGRAGRVRRRGHRLGAAPRLRAAVGRSRIRTRGDWNRHVHVHVVNPATEQAVTTVPSCSAEEADEAIERAAAAQPAWRAVAPGDRARLLRRVRRAGRRAPRRSWPSSRSPAPATRSGRPAGRRATSATCSLLLRRARAAHRPPDPGGGRPRRHLPGAARRRRPDRAVELPHADPGAGGWRPRSPPATRSSPSPPSSPR